MFNSLYKRLTGILSYKYISVIIIIFSLACRLIQIIFFFNIRSDASFQLIATDNFLHGHGISIGHVLSSNLSQITSSPLINWPPGYSILIIPLYILTDHDYLWSGILLSSIAAIVLLVYARKIVLILNVSANSANLYTIVTALFIYPFYFKASSDAIAICFFIVGLFYLLSLTRKNEKSSFPLILSTLSFLVSGTIKYLFIPIIFIPPFVLILYGSVHKNIRLKTIGLIITSLLFLSVGSLLLYQKLISGSATYISSGGRGIFFEHLSHAYPFIVASIIKPETYALLVSQVIYDSTFSFIQLLNWLFLLSFLIVILKILSSKKNLLFKDIYTLITSSVIVVTAGTLIYLSITVSKEEINFNTYWTYVQEPRYYGLPIVLLHISFFVWLNSQSLKKIKNRTAIVIFILSLLMFLEIIRGFIFISNRVKYFGKEEYSWQYENRFQKFADSILREAKTRHSTDRTVVAGPIYYYNNRIRLFSHTDILADYSSLNNLKTLKTKRPVIILALFAEENKNFFQPFISSKQALYEGRFDKFLFYSLYVSPSK